MKTKNMDKDIPMKVIDIVTWHSFSYSPRFIRCPNCEHSVLKSWEKPEKCSYCEQKLLWD
jgi:hypothetical protein